MSSHSALKCLFLFCLEAHYSHMMVQGYNSWWGIYQLRCVVMQAKILHNCFYNVTPCRLHINIIRLFLCLPLIQMYFFLCFFFFFTSFLPFLSLSDMMSLRVSGCAAMCIFRKRATTRCLAWRKELCTNSGFVLLTRLEQDAPPRPPNPCSLQTPWNTPGPWVTHNALRDSRIVS